MVCNAAQNMKIRSLVWDRMPAQGTVNLTTLCNEVCTIVPEVDSVDVWMAIQQMISGGIVVNIRPNEFARK